MHASERNSRIKRTYGITTAQYEDLVAYQEGLCAICQTKPVKLVIDHAHDTGRVRGLLCPHCNAGIGHLRENPEVMIAAIAYLSTEFLTSGKSLEGFDLAQLQADLSAL